MISCFRADKIVKVDGCMAQIIQTLNSRSIKTLGCCCGHRRYPMTIVISDFFGNSNIEIFSGKVIPRKRKFYRLDQKGYYYIPEVSNAKP